MLQHLHFRPTLIPTDVVQTKAKAALMMACVTRPVTSSGKGSPVRARRVLTESTVKPVSKIESH